MDLNDLRQFLKDQSARLQAQADHILFIENAKEDAELSLLANATSIFSPIPVANLSVSLNAAAPMDEKRVSEICKSLLSEMEGRLLAAIYKSIPDLRWLLRRLLPGPRSPLVYQEYFRLFLYNLQHLPQLLR